MVHEQKSNVNELIRLYNLSGKANPVFAATVIVSTDGTTITAIGPGGLIATGTNAATVIQAAITSIASSGGDVLIKRGTYVLTATLTVAKKMVISGEGPDTVLQFDGSVVTTGIKMADTTQRQVSIRDMTITSSTAGAGTAIDASKFVFSELSNLTLDSVNIGIDFNATGTLYNTVINPRILAGGASGCGIRFDTSSNSNTVIGGKISATDNNPTGIYVNAHSIRLFGVDVEGGTFDPLIGIDIAASGHDCLMSGIYLEGCATNLRFALNVEGPTVIGGFNGDATTAELTDNGAVKPCLLNIRAGNGSYEPYFRLPEQVGSADPIASDIPNRQWCLWRTTTGGQIALWYNDNGSLKKAVLS